LDFLKTREGINYSFREGVYIHFGENGNPELVRRVDLVYFDPDTKDVYLPNGKFNGKRFETLCYATNQTFDQEA
jgi:hypothetical protein